MESCNNHGILGKMVELLYEMDMNIVITNVYIYWDEEWRWPMEVLNMTVFYGNKSTRQKVIDYIKKGLDSINDDNLFVHCSVEESKKVAHFEPFCSIELTETDKRGLCKVRGVAAAIAGPNCEMMKADICTHVSQIFAVFRSKSLVKQSLCRYLSLKSAQETTPSFLFKTLFARSKQPKLKRISQNDASNKRTIMSSKIQKKVRVIRFPSVNGKGSKTSRIK